ncbi:MAG: thiamine-phosphate pyrophosphorylase [Fibrobacterota bacterium]
MQTDNDSAAVYRILDANMNRLREGLRVVEEYYRFYREDRETTVTLKALRHALQDMERVLGRKNLLSHRNSRKDVLSSGSSEKEQERSDMDSLFRANIRRAQEAARSIEEYSKLLEFPGVSHTAKEIRFALYETEKK